MTISAESRWTLRLVVEGRWALFTKCWCEGSVTHMIASQHHQYLMSRGDAYLE